MFSKKCRGHFSLCCWKKQRNSWIKLFTGKESNHSVFKVWTGIDFCNFFYVSQGKADRQQDLGKLILLVCVDTEARHRGAGEAGAVRQFPHSTDVTHRFVFQGRRWDFHLVLLVYRLMAKHKHAKTDLLFSFGKGHKRSLDRNRAPVPLTQEGAGDVFRHLVTGATHLRQVGQLSVQHPLKLWQWEQNKETLSKLGCSKLTIK